MDDDLLAYYNTELTFIREMGAEFAAKYPKVAGRLLLDAEKCEDPHVERLLEGFAFLAARIRQKLDDEFPEITGALLHTLYPHFLRPLPSMSVVQFLPGPEPAKLAGGYTIAQGARMTARPVGGVACQFRTTYPVTLWPIEVKEARLQHDRVVFPGKPPEATALVQLTLRCAEGTSFAQLTIDQLRFYLDGDPQVVHALYASLFNHVCLVLAQGRRDDGALETVALPKGAVRAVGFGLDEGMFPYPARSFAGYRLIQEYFAFPEKFLFFDLTGLERLAGRPWGESLELLFFLNQAPKAEISIDAANVRLGCAPIVNLFPIIAEPIPLTQARAEYRVVPDVHRPLSTEVYSVDSVTSTAAFLDEPVEYEPFHALRHTRGGRGGQAYWSAVRRPSQRQNDPGTEVYLSFVDTEFNPSRPAGESITVRATCTNRDLPSRLPFGGDQGDFQLAAPGPVSRVRCLRKPTTSLRPRLGRGSHWRLISHLSLNHLSLADSEQGLDALQAILRLYDLADSSVTRQQIHGITRVASRRVAGRTGNPNGNAVCMGIEITLEFDESSFVGSGVFLLASVLERFFGMYASINSFSQLVATIRQREGIVKRWPPRAGDRSLL